MTRLETSNGVLETSNGVLVTSSFTPEIDFFDDGDIAEYGADTDRFQTVTTTVEDGSHALEATSFSNGDEASLISNQGEGLPNYIQQGDTWEWYGQITDTADIVFCWYGAQSETNLPNGNRVQWGVDATAITRMDNGTQTILASQNVPLGDYLNEYLRCVASWSQNGDMSMYLYNPAGYEISRNEGVNDTTYQSGATGWGAFSDDGAEATCFIDSAKLITGHTPATIIDSAEDGDINEYSGNTFQYEAVDSPSFHGDASVEADINSTSTIAGITSTSGLNAYPSQGDTFRCGIQHPSLDHDLHVAWAAQSDGATADSYAIESAGRDDSFNILKWTSGSTSTLASTSVDYSGHASEWLTIEVTWLSDGTIEAQLFDVDGNELTNGGISATDTDFTSGGWGYRIINPLLESTTGNYDFGRII